MYTLLSPEAQPYVRPEDEVDPEPEIPFILDGERVSNHLYPRVVRGVLVVCYSSNFVFVFSLSTMDQKWFAYIVFMHV